jgi:glyoxylase-like metal-dependent hydrolase (beta-lactamase superfamily II)
MDEAPATADWIPGRCVPVAPGVRRVLAPNPGHMTGPGTNTYLVGRERLVILDPGPAIDSHVAAIVAAVAGATVVAIAVTHTHHDHSAAAAPLHAALGAPRRGAAPRHREFHDATFVADLPTGDGAILDTDVGELLAVATPGHASNHLCWFEPGERRLYTGDHVLGTVSPVILPPDGDMSEYLDSLARIDALAAQAILPGHGPVLEQPRAVIAALIRHRLMREQRVLAALQDLGPASIEALLPRVYADVDPALHSVARYSLEAHLLKLEHECRARLADGRWRAR